MTLADYAARAATRLQAAGLGDDDARRDAALLARTALGWDTARWLTHSREPAPLDFPARLAPLIDRRAAREPIAYITGEREFYGRPFRVTPDVLIPRPETELVVDEALGAIGPQASGHGPHDGRAVLGPWVPGPGPVLVDVGTGSGCLAVTLALECRSARVRATDTSPAALEVARENARRFGVEDRIDFTAAALLGVGEGAGRVDVIVANLPYVPDGDRPLLAADVRHEPPEALFAGHDGLDFIRALIAQAPESLNPGGRLIAEIGIGQADEVARLLHATGTLSLDHIARDLQGIARVVVARR
jgi:release factor glutamine methyltransferase